MDKANLYKENTSAALSEEAEKIVKEKAPVLLMLTKKIEEVPEGIRVKGFGLLKMVRTEERTADTDRLSIEFGFDRYLPIKFGYRYGFPFIKGFRFNTFEFTLPLDNLAEMDIQNRIALELDRGYPGRIRYRGLDGRRSKYRNSKIFFRDGYAVYLRQTPFNTTYLTVRKPNPFDYPEYSKRANLAKLASYFYPKSNFVLMYEKECRKYEESASVLFERLVDEGYRNIYYIIDPESEDAKSISDKYRPYLVDKHSFKHLLLFYKCKRFITTETLSHAVQLRAANRHIQSKYNNKDLAYVFLQHGVMYMISLDSSMRGGFRNTKIKKHRVVVSSEKEAEHFIKLGHFEPENMYITGLAKFDRSYMNEGADKIIIMPTWRRWEANQAKDDFASTGYYSLLEDMVEAIPEEHKDKMEILLHPLMREAMGENNTNLAPYIYMGNSYDEALRDCRLLITDYSSIAYDAFYRGANAVFYWRDKEECLEHYGGAHLLLNENNAFGDVCYNVEELSEAVKACYMKEQKQEYLEKYREIVEFHDNNNSNRIIEKLKDDGLI